MLNDLSSFARLSSDIAALVAAVGPSVVTVGARPHRGSSGIALGGDLVVTADHAVERDRDITVTVNGTRHDAVLAARDRATDLAVLRVVGLDAPAAAAAPAPTTGSLVVSVSRTTSGTVSAGLGVITSVGGPLRTARGVVLPSIIRTDAALRPGTAGGALVDAQGRIVGVTTPGLMRGLPVAIPAVEAFELARRLAAREPLGRGYLGVSVQAVRLGRAQQEAAPDGQGLLISGVSPDGSADRAGMLVGDVVLQFGDRVVRSADELQDALATSQPGTEVAVLLLRGASRQQLTLTVGERPVP